MPDEYSELRARIAKLGMTQTGLARRMKELGDDRDEKNILRSIQRMIAGDIRFSGEMRALLGLMEQVSNAQQVDTQAKPRVIPPQITNGKSPSGHFHVRLLIPLPAKTPYGNFQLKFLKIRDRIDEVNEWIATSYEWWTSNITAHRNPDGSPTKGRNHSFALEVTVSFMRRAADELVAMMWCLAEEEKNGEFPSEVKIDAIGRLTNDQVLSEELPGLEIDVEFVRLLNEISNALKHSFINSDITLIGGDEPRVNVLDLRWNKLSGKEQFYNITLSELVEKYDSFYTTCLRWLGEYSARRLRRDGTRTVAAS